MDQPKKIYVDDFMPEEEDELQTMPSKAFDRSQYEEYKSKFDIKKIVSNFILKKQYFITHKKTSIFNDYTLDDKILGKGSFGVVYKATEKNTGIVRAAKKVMNENIQNYDGFMNEVEALKTLDHPNIIKLFDVYEDKD